MEQQELAQSSALLLLLLEFRNPGQDGSAQGAVPALCHCHLHAMSPQAPVLLSVCAALFWGGRIPLDVCAGQGHPSVVFVPKNSFVCLSRVPGKIHWVSTPKSGAGSPHTLGMRCFMALPGFQAVGECGC